MPTDSIVYEADPGEVRMWNFNVMRTELHKTLCGAQAEWEVGDWIHKDSEGRLTRLTEPPLAASSNDSAKLLPVKVRKKRICGQRR